MEEFLLPVQVRWSDLDPNFHLRHSVYYDWGAFCRLEFFTQYGLSSGLMHQLHFGPILFREECVFRREVVLEDPVTISLQLLQAKRDYSRWSIEHVIMKNKGTVAAVLTVDGAWLDTAKRKLVTPPRRATDVFSAIPVDENFQWRD